MRGCICSQGWAGDIAVFVIRVHLHTGMVGVGDGVYLNPGMGMGMRMEQCWGGGVSAPRHRMGMEQCW